MGLSSNRAFILAAILLILLVGIARLDLHTRPTAGASGAGVTDPADTAGLGATHAEFVQAVLANDGHRLAGFYAESASFLVPGLPTLHGRGAIEAFLAKALATTRYEEFTFTPTAISARGGMVSEVGWQQDRSRAAGQPPQTAYGRYAITWLRSADGKWQMVMDAAVVDSTAPASPVVGTSPPKADPPATHPE